MNSPRNGPQPNRSLAALTEALSGLRCFDVSPSVDGETSMWHTHRAPTISPVAGHQQQGVAVNRIELSEHTGAHVDAPFHFDPDGLTVDQLAADSLLLKPYRKYDLTGDGLEPGDLIEPEQLEAAAARGGFTAPPAGGVAIVEVGWDRNLPGGAAGREPGWWGRNQPGLSAAACDHLAAMEVVAVASDTGACDVAAVDGESLSADGHRRSLLPRGILIVEGLTGLSRAPAQGLFVGLPLKITGGTASPLRILLLA